jgi:PEP-CTERM motif
VTQASISKENQMFKNYVVGALAAMAAVTSAHAAGFVNGGFDDGTTTGWTIGGGSRNGANLSALNPSSYLPAVGTGTDARSAVVTPGLDPFMGALMPNRVYAGSGAYRLQEVNVTGGFVSVISQTVNNYTDANIFFTWMAALEGAHSAQQAAGMIITLEDLTAGDTPISRVYSAETSGVDTRFTLSPQCYYYTNAWQIEQLTIDSSRQGHDFRLTVLATDCGPTGHAGWVYLDGFGSVVPPTGVPEPGSLALAGAALVGLAAARRRRKA